MVERTFHQVMLVFGVHRDPPPLGLSFESIAVDNPDYVAGSFNAYVDTSIDYATWFAMSSVGLIMGDVHVSKGKVLGGITRGQVASRAKWRSLAKTLQARVKELETTVAAKEAYMHEEIARALA